MGEGRVALLPQEILHLTQRFGIPWWLRQERIRLQCRRPEFDSWVGKITWRGGYGNPLQCSCLENPEGQRSLTGYSPWDCRVRHDWVTRHSTSIVNAMDKTQKMCHRNSEMVVVISTWQHQGEFHGRGNVWIGSWVGKVWEWSDAKETDSTEYRLGNIEL